MKLLTTLLVGTLAVTAVHSQPIYGLRTILEVSYINSNYALGYAMLGLGDVNNDGKPDFAVGAFNIDRTFIYFGGKGVLDSLPDLSVKGGMNLAKGDFNGDGRMDLFAIMRESLLVYYGKPPDPVAIDTVPGLVLSGMGIRDWAETSVAVGDLNNDGFDDLVIGYSSFGRSEGKVFVFMGSPNPTVVPNYSGIGDTVLSRYGMKVAIGDVNGDGVLDLTISSFGNSPSNATIDIFYGHTGWTYAKGSFNERIDSHEGNPYSLAYFNLVDVNADHTDDILISLGDSAKVFIGRPDSISRTPDIILRIPDTTFYRGFEFHAANIGDFNGDGRDDFVMEASPGGPAECLIVYLGGAMPRPVAGRCKGFVATSGAFSITAALGDVNGDGQNDFGTTAPYDALGQPPQNGYFVILSGDNSLTVPDGEDATLPREVTLEQNFPNPFNPKTMIRYMLTRRTHVTLEIMNVLGQVVATPVQALEETGEHKVVWEAEDLSSGVYFYQMRTEHAISTKKMILLR